MPNEITTLVQTIQITEVSDIVVTDIVQNTEGDWVREVRILGVPALVEEGQPIPTGPVIFTLRLLSATKAALEITHPQSQF